MFYLLNVMEDPWDNWCTEGRSEQELRWNWEAALRKESHRFRKPIYRVMIRPHGTVEVDFSKPLPRKRTV